MAELHELMDQAMRAQGKVDPAEVREKAAVLDPDDLGIPDPAGTPDGDEAAEEAAEQLALGTMCATCNGRRRKWNERMGDYIRCPDCATPLPDPERLDIGKFSDPNVSGAPETQRQAAIIVYPKSGSQRMAVLTQIAESGDRGMTDDEVEEALHLRSQSVTPRRNELMNDGWVIDSGYRRTTVSGRQAVVWVLSEQGREEWAER